MCYLRFEQMGFASIYVQTLSLFAGKPIHMIFIAHLTLIFWKKACTYSRVIWNLVVEFVRLNRKYSNIQIKKIESILSSAKF